MNERGGKTTKKTCNDLGICMPKVFSSGRIHGFRGRQDKHLENPLSITEQTNHGRLKKKKKVRESREVWYVLCTCSSLGIHLRLLLEADGLDRYLVRTNSDVFLPSWYSLGLHLIVIEREVRIYATVICDSLFKS